MAPTFLNILRRAYVDAPAARTSAQGLLDRIADLEGRLIRTRADLVAPDGIVQAVLDALPDGVVITAGNVPFEKQDGASAFPDIPNFIPAYGIASPAHWTDEDPETGDCTEAVQAAFDWARQGFQTTVGAFGRTVNFLGRIWRVTSPINATNIRQPFFSFGNGGIFGDMTGGTVLEAYGTNTGRIIAPFCIQAPISRTARPKFGFAIGRCEFAGVEAPISPSWVGEIDLVGCFSGAAFLNFGSEVSNLKVNVLQREPGQAAACSAQFGMLAHGDRWGGIASDFVTLPDPNTAVSNILHKVDGELKHGALYVITVTGITMSNPVVIHFSPSNAGLSLVEEGDEVLLNGLTGADELNHRKFTIADFDPVAGTLSLAGEDGTGHTPWTSGGRLWTATGPALILGSVQGYTLAPRSYLLSYGYPPVLMDMRYGSLGAIDLQFQPETNSEYLAEIDVGDQTAIISELRIDALCRNQTMTGAPIKLTRTTGTLRIDSFHLRIGPHYGALAHAVSSDAAHVNIRNAHLHLPTDDDLVLDGLATFSGFVETTEPQQSRWYATPSVWAEASLAGLQLRRQSTAPTGAPIFDFHKETDAPSSDEWLGLMRFYGNDIPAATIRARWPDVGAGVETANLEFLTYVEGAEEQAFKLDPRMVDDESAAIVLVKLGGSLAVRRLLVGAADSAGTGYRTVRVGN